MSFKASGCTLSLFILACTIAYFTSSVHARSIPQKTQVAQSGDREIVKVRGVSFVLPNNDEAEDIKFSIYPDWRSISLKDVLADPNKAKKFFDSGRTVTLTIPVIGRDRPVHFLGIFKRSDYLNYTLSIQLGPDSQGNCRAWEANYREFPKKYASKFAAAETKDWIELSVGEKPITLVFIRRQPTNQIPTTFENVSCGLDNTCNGRSCVDNDKSVSYRFPKPNVMPDDLDASIQKVRDVLQLVWPDMNGLAEDGK